MVIHSRTIICILIFTDVVAKSSSAYALAVNNAPETFQSVDNLQYTEQKQPPSYSTLGYGVMVGLHFSASLFKNTEE